MASLHCEALLLRCVEFGESDRIVHLLTPGEGRLSAIAKGARRSVRRFPGTLDLFNHLQIQVERRRRSSLARLEHATLISPFLPIRADPRRFALACYVAELFSRFAPEGGPRDDTERLYRFALDALRAIERGSPGPGLRVLIQLRALDALGLRPELACCVRCNRDVHTSTRLHFSVEEGGAMCEGCASGRQAVRVVHAGTLRALSQALSFEVKQLDRLSLSGELLREALALVGSFERFHVGVGLRSERFLEQMLGSGERPRSA